MAAARHGQVRQLRQLAEQHEVALAGGHGVQQAEGAHGPADVQRHRVSPVDARAHDRHGAAVTERGGREALHVPAAQHLVAGQHHGLGALRGQHLGQLVQPARAVGQPHAQRLVAQLGQPAPQQGVVGAGAGQADGSDGVHGVQVDRVDQVDQVGQQEGYMQRQSTCAQSGYPPPHGISPPHGTVGPTHLHTWELSHRHSTLSALAGTAGRAQRAIAGRRCAGGGALETRGFRRPAARTAVGACGRRFRPGRGAAEALLPAPPPPPPPALRCWCWVASRPCLPPSTQSQWTTTSWPWPRL